MGVAAGQQQQRCVAGLDLDHTLISYERPLRRWAETLGVTRREGESLKDAVRRHCWESPEGDAAWQRVQADIYGHSLHEAEPAPGALDFLAWATKAGIPVVVVSHKSHFAAAAAAGPNLRETALAWMAEHGFFSEENTLSRQQVFFEASRSEKVARIAALGCTHFVDDLPKVFLEPGFPRETKQILYAPDGAEPGTWRVEGTWASIGSVLWEFLTSAIWQDRELLLAQHTEATGKILTRLHGGRNSRVYSLKSHCSPPTIIKVYADIKRAEDEFSALMFLQRLGVAGVQHPTSMIPAECRVTYAYIEGAPPGDDILDADIDAAIALIRNINAPHRLRETWSRPAAEAAFTFADLCTNIRQRITRLLAAAQVTSSHSDMTLLLQRAVLPIFEPLEARHAADSTELPEGGRILSPSDFGFHNAIRRPDGSLVFIDFEYFGWDDPAKLVSDFLWHPAMQLSEEHKQRFVSGIAHALDNRALLAQRLPVAYPLYGVKWCTILLNEFLPEHWARRTFAGDTRPRETVLAEQLGKVRALAARIAEADGFPYEL